MYNLHFLPLASFCVLSCVSFFFKVSFFFFSSFKWPLGNKKIPVKIQAAAHVCVVLRRRSVL